MDKPLLNSSEHPHTYDCIGIGFGPSNIAFAIALEEKGLLENSLFLEARDEVLWHPGMLIEGTDIQHNPLRDFITPRNPCSPYGFLSYLKDQDRLFDYLNLSAPFPPRTEYGGYVSWVARQFLDYVKLSVQTTEIAIVQNEPGKHLFEIRSADGQSYFARTVVLGCGRSRYIPLEFQDLLCEDIIHSDDYIWAKKRWLDKEKKLKIAVIGGSQSAVEVLLDLSADCVVVGITRSFGFKQKDLSPFTECIYYPEFVDYFHGSDVQSQNQITRELWRSNYSSADHDVINTLNFKLYEEKVVGKQCILLHQNSLIKNIESLPGSGKYQIKLADRYNKIENSIVVDGIIFATGYKNFGKLENQEPYHPLLEGISSYLILREDGGLDILRDYQIKTKGLNVPVYLNGLCEASHGFGDAGSFSTLSIRGDMIASSLQSFYQSTQVQNNTTPLTRVEAHV